MGHIVSWHQDLAQAVRTMSDTQQRFAGHRPPLQGVKLTPCIFPFQIGAEQLIDILNNGANSYRQDPLYTWRQSDWKDS
jgi:hypothetical protein